MPEANRQPGLTHTDRLPNVTEIGQDITDRDEYLNDSDKQKQTVEQDPRLSEAEEQFGRTQLDRHPANLVIFRKFNTQLDINPLFLDTNT